MDVYIVSAKRTPMGSFGGMLKGYSAIDLGSIAIKSAIEETGIDPASIEEVYMGNVCQANLGQAPARQAALKAGLSMSVPCTTINKVCSSGLKSVMIASQTIALGLADIIVAGGMESMSNIPYYLPQMRWGSKYGSQETVDGLQKDGLTDAYNFKAMGYSGDETAKYYNISREAQDEYAINSYRRAEYATVHGKFVNEIVPISIPQRKGDHILMSEDEEYKNVDFSKIPILKPAFNKDGTVTAANASTLNDGAAALVLASKAAVKKYNLKPLARVVSFADAAHEPEWFTTAPAKAAPLALKRAGLSTKDIDYYEVNEAFSVVPMVFAQSCEIELSKVNIHGGAVALGHPLGCSGARILTTLVHTLTQQGGAKGLATLCNGGGGASALIIEQ